MRTRSWRVGKGSVWESRFMRALGGQSSTSGDLTVLQSMGQFVPLTATGPQVAGPHPEDRADRLSTWASSGRLTYGDAEALLALDESTSWGSR